MSDTRVTPLSIAEWVDSDLHESLAETMRYRAARVFAVRSDGALLERELVDSDADPYRLLTRIPVWRPVDALCLVMTGWMSRIDVDDDHRDDHRDELDDELDALLDDSRERVRVTAAVNDQGVSVVVRRWDLEGQTDSFADGGEGIFPEALRVWWTAFDAVRRQPEGR
ncbi:MAG: hypothetical protein FJW18_01060 [Actinobacteria bacterium]|nr:hypothetical protein [Actinomycetota bacterium]